VYAGLLLLGLAFYAALRVRDPNRARRIGTIQDFEIEAELPGDQAEPLHAGASV
jgi:hypothetical protein